MLELAAAARQHAELSGYDCLLVDTAGRMPTDEQLMEELTALHKQLRPAEVLYVLDCMAGQDAAQAAQVFADSLPISGIVISKADSSVRAGAVLSVQYLLKKPIKLLSDGEEMTAISSFDPKRFASRIMGVGDGMDVLIQHAQMTEGDESNSSLKKEMQGDSDFSFNAMREQLQQLKKMGGMSALVEKMGLNKGAAAMLQQQLADKQTTKFIGFIDSMTPLERQRPDILNSSRKLRISKGAGGSLAELNQLLKKLKDMRKISRKGKTAKGRQALMGRLDSIMGKPGGMSMP